jgi:hypothetical protein
MKNKLLITSALTTLIAGSAVAETKVSGNLEQVIRLNSQGSTGAASEQGIGSEYNIGLSSSKSLDNGLNAKYGFTLEDGSPDTHYLTVGTDTVSVTIGADTGLNLSSSAIPHIGDQAGTLVADLGGTYNNQGYATGTAGTITDAHEDDHISVDVKAMGGTLTARYSPDSNGGGNTDSGISANSGSSREFLYTGSLGVEGLNVIIGTATQDSNISTKEDGKFKKAGFGYNMGQISFGIETQKAESIAAASSQVETSSDKASVTYAVNDNLSVGLQRIETSRKSGGTKDANDEEINVVSVGYSLGGLGIEINYSDVQNVGNAANTDSEALQIRTIQKF